MMLTEWEISDLFLFVDILYFLIGPLDKLWQFIFAKDDLNIFMTFFSIKIVTRFHLILLLQRKLLVIIVIETIKDESPRFTLSLFLANR